MGQSKILSKASRGGLLIVPMRLSAPDARSSERNWCPIMPTLLNDLVLRPDARGRCSFWFGRMRSPRRIAKESHGKQGKLAGCMQLREPYLTRVYGRAPPWHTPKRRMQADNARAAVGRNFSRANSFCAFRELAFPPGRVRYARSRLPRARPTLFFIGA